MRGTRVAQLVKYWTLDLGSGHDLRVMLGFISARSLLEILSLCPLPLPMHSLKKERVFGKRKN